MVIKDKTAHALNLMKHKKSPNRISNFLDHRSYAQVDFFNFFVLVVMTTRRPICTHHFQRWCTANQALSPSHPKILQLTLMWLCKMRVVKFWIVIELQTSYLTKLLCAADDVLIFKRLCPVQIMVARPNQLTMVEPFTAIGGPFPATSLGLELCWLFSLTASWPRGSLGR